jgi:hypothetical protein
MKTPPQQAAGYLKDKISECAVAHFRTNKVTKQASGNCTLEDSKSDEQQEANRGTITPQSNRRWQEIRGTALFPLTGEDAQHWVSKSRREDGEQGYTGQ